MSEEVIASDILDRSSILLISTLMGMHWFRQGVIVVTVDADICLNANNIVNFQRVAVAA